MREAEAGWLTRCPVRHEPWRELEGWTATAQVEASSMAVSFPRQRPGKDYEQSLHLLSGAPGVKSSVSGLHCLAFVSS